MSLNRGELNPLDVLGMRKLHFIPEHFSCIKISNIVDIRNVEQWIVYNLNSRYAIQKKLDLDSSNKITTIYEIGLEDPKELILLNLGCTTLHNKG